MGKYLVIGKKVCSHRLADFRISLDQSFTTVEPIISAFDDLKDALEHASKFNGYVVKIVDIEVKEAGE